MKEKNVEITKEVKKTKTPKEKPTEQEFEELENLEKEYWEAQEKFISLQEKVNTFKEKQRKKWFGEGSQNSDNDDDENPKNKSKKMKGFGKGSFPWINILLGIVAITIAVNYFTRPSPTLLPVSQFMQEYTSGQYSEISITGETATATKADGTKVSAIVGERDSFSALGLLDPAKQQATKITIKGSASSRFWTDFFLSFLPIILIIGLMVYSMRGMRGGGGFPFMGSKRGMEPIKPTTTFADVAGQDEAKYELKEIVEFLKKPTQFIKMGAKIPKGVLLSGPPGTGKTLLARAVAGEAHVPFFSISGSEFVEMFVGVGASRVRSLFENARQQAPSIIFIDEIDAIGRQRSSGMGGGANDEREQTLNQILTEMDGFENETGVIVIAATNRVDILDKALLRPGRFDRRIGVMNPTIKDREAILGVHAKDKPMDPSVQLEKIAARTVGFSGADLENMLNEAAIFAARAKRKTITSADIDQAIDRVTMGTEKKSLVMSDEEKKMTAYHEVGHALVAYFMKTADPVHKITIIPRGMALGATHIAPEKESYHSTKTKYFEEICVLLGGLSAEKIIFNDTTSGVSNDLERASRIAYAMVMKFGMSDEIGPVVYSAPGEESIGRPHSEEYARKIDEAVEKTIKKAYETTKDTLIQHIDTVHLVSEKLLQEETLDREQFETLVKESLEKSI